LEGGPSEQREGGRAWREGGREPGREPRDGGERREGGERRDCYGYPFLFLDTHGFHCQVGYPIEFWISINPKR